MAKTLIIKGASFGTNKVTTVSFGGNVPCTGVSISESSVSATDYDPITLTYEVTPSNTTDAILWTSSDPTVATVDGGVITPVGLGTATITAACGNFSDTVSVTVAIICVPRYEIGRLSTQPLYVTNAADVTNRVTATGYGTQKATHGMQKMTTGFEDMAGIKLPNNTSSVTVAISSPTNIYYGDNVHAYWMTDEACGDTTFPFAAKYVKTEDAYNARTENSKTFSVPEGADTFAVFIRLGSNTSKTAAEVMSEEGFSITFNAAS